MTVIRRRGRWSDAEIAHMLELRASGRTLAEAAAILGRPLASVKNHSARATPPELKGRHGKLKRPPRPKPHATPAAGETWTHLKSGNVYDVLHLGQMRPTGKKRRWLPCVVYRRAGTGEVYCRRLVCFRAGFVKEGT